MTSRNVISLGGIAFVALFATAFVVGGSTPDPHASAGTVAAYYHAHHDREMVAAFALATAVFFLILFAAALSTADWPGREGRRPLWQLVLTAGGAMSGAAMLVGVTAHFALADAAGHVSPSALQSLNLIDSDIWVAFNPALGVMMLGTAGTLVTSARGHRRLGWCAAVLGVALFIPFADFFALLASGLWIVVASVMLREPAATRSISESPMPPLAREGSA